MVNDRPIGVFDSGIGGLTVVKNLIKILPNENIIYFSDIARMPYGNKSELTIQKFASQIAKFLVEQKVKAIIIACNTISAIAKFIVKQIVGNIPTVDVISAGISLVKKLDTIGVIATPATINSNAYSLGIRKANSNAKVYCKACSLFVPMIEEGFIEGKIVEAVAREYLEYFFDKSLDALILGCTHYPIIKESISPMLNQVELIDPSLQSGRMLADLLKQKQLLNLQKQSQVKYKFYVTGTPIKFKLMGEMFLQTQMQDLEIVNLDGY